MLFKKLKFLLREKISFWTPKEVQQLLELARIVTFQKIKFLMKIVSNIVLSLSLLCLF